MSKILAIETSCDETGAAVYDTDKGIISNALFSQIDLHKKYGGVVPEIASRSHLEKINLIIQKALDHAKLKLDDIETIAVVNNPGLPGSLLVGVCFAKALAACKNKKIIGINHLEAHIFSACLENSIPFPFLCLTASGGHTAIYLVKDWGIYTCVVPAIDDAAGEAFDKVAKLIDLPYPGGPEIEKLSTSVNYEDFFKYPRSKSKALNFSFSGLKTAVLYDLAKRGAYDLKNKNFLKKDDQLFKAQVASSLLNAIADIFVNKLEQTYKKYPEVKAITFVGGVACNKFIRNKIETFCKKINLNFFFPSPQYCTDNAAMAAFVANYKAQQNKFDDLTLDIL
ncbi:TPA: tRNA (adenosine(37)-N6)-threonylcarbamoyltransferase complex transferase subunit TsaD [Candidatus Dependentiae bacterium]|nr:MAG: putative tRNA threonylcarbamoyladenosine biosynthesis protein Gcp [candidate division TM6 bacterium GW2011_GWF2_36_131]KKQ03833.1 MAG: putative tRNA threonylcarbamoyladenosine biosynthesis protein Gcp [candidate division TM6 bacterium GW2011_GWE2_36_25]KKQ19458.1 MAG: putative tRNA threonylcarbamoyladenosine biosynthesis protein Gcp [candidate division TM6 bacterium GW2011_GWA2_36_9]HBR70601.1 tRNA (adenosine(37)-N6)-threonylcarbamoyltransferase complex transferase subunit TsaD [Candidat